MKKVVSLVLSLCMVGLSSCIQITTPQQQTLPVNETTMQQTVAPVQQTIAPVQQTVAPIQSQQDQQIQQTQPVQPVQPIQGGYSMPQFAITIDQAKQNALNAVGMNAANVTFIKQKQDYDDGMPEYEIEFVANNMKYEFEISGVNGAILKQEIESVYD